MSYAEREVEELEAKQEMERRIGSRKREKITIDRDTVLRRQFTLVTNTASDLFFESHKLVWKTKNLVSLVQFCTQINL